MLKKIGRWTAARLQGSKGKEKYDDWMRRNPLASTALTVGDIALAGYAAPKLVGGLKGLLGAKGAAGATQAVDLGTDVTSSMARNAAFEQGASRMPTVAPTMTQRAQAALEGARSAPSMFTREGLQQFGGNVADVGGRVGRGAMAAGRYAAKNPLPMAMALEGLLTGSQQAQQMRLERERDRQRQEQQQFLAQLLAPTFTQYYGGM